MMPDCKHDRETEAPATIRRIGTDKFNDHLMMILIRFIGAILRIVCVHALVDLCALHQFRHLLTLRGCCRLGHVCRERISTNLIGFFRQIQVAHEHR
jgi:hypothetical protein